MKIKTMERVEKLTTLSGAHVKLKETVCKIE